MEHDEGNSPSFSGHNLALLLETVPAAMGLIRGEQLVLANAAFANAFGYRSFAELAQAGGLAAIIPEGLAQAETVMSTGRAGRTHLRTSALTRGARAIKVNFELVPLKTESEGETPLTVLRLVDQISAQAPQTAELAPNPASCADGPTLTALAGAMQNDPSAEQQLSFLAKVSHEVRTPLNSILGFTELMMGEKLGPIGNDRYKGYIDDIRQSGLYALSLLNDLLDLSKIEAGKFELDFAAVNVAESVDECVRLLQPLAKRERILLRVSFVPNLPMVLADPRRLKQILLNLISNAIKFTGDGGQVIISAKQFDNGELQLRVRDNGVGMTADELALAMQPFQQLDTAPRKQSGTGLGLPLTKALIEASRARFVLSSEPGIGTSADVLFRPDRLVVPTHG